jgi:hypothetical protein
MANATKCILVGSKEQKMEKCKYCGNMPFIADVGGNNPYYEIYCGCGENTVIGATDKEEVIKTWDVIQKG